MFFTGRDWETSQDRGTNEQNKYREILDENWGEGSPSKRTTTLRTQPRQCRRGKQVSECPWPSQSPDLNPINHLWRDLKIAVQRRFSSNLTEMRGSAEKTAQTIQIYLTQSPGLVQHRPHSFIQLRAQG
jgi:transposase